MCIRDRYITLVVGDNKKYARACKELENICKGFTPDVEVYSIDEMFLDLTLPMDKSRGFQGLLGRHGPYWRYFQKSGDVVFLFPFYSQKPLDFLNKAPDGTIRVEGSQLNLLVAIYIC